MNSLIAAAAAIAKYPFSVRYRDDGKWLVLIGRQPVIETEDREYAKRCYIQLREQWRKEQ